MHIVAGQLAERLDQIVLVALDGGKMILVGTGNADQAVAHVDQAALIEHRTDGDLLLPDVADPFLPAGIGLVG